MMLNLIELADNVFAWRRVSSGGVVLWSFRNERRLLLIDTGSEEGAAQGLLDIAHRFRPHKVYIANTHQHRDHVFANQLLVERAKAHLWTPGAAGATLSCFDLDDLAVGVIPAPGHSEDSTAFLVATSLFTGDAVYSPEVLRRFPIPAYENVGSALESLDLLRRTYLKLLAKSEKAANCWLVTGHGRPLANNEALMAIDGCVNSVKAALQAMKQLWVPREPLTSDQVAAWLKFTRTPVRPGRFAYWQRVAAAYRKELERIKACDNC